MIVWDSEPTEYGDFSGTVHAIGAVVSVEHVRGQWSFHAWGATGTLIYRSDRFYPTADVAKRAAEAWATSATGAPFDR